MSLNKKIFILKTTSGQEKNVAKILARRIETLNSQIYSIAVLPNIKGYVFIEAEKKEDISKISYGIRYLRGKLPTPISIDEIIPHLEKPTIDIISAGDIVEIIAGPLKGLSGKVTRIDKPKKEVMIEISESAFVLPISIPIDYVKILSKKVEKK